MLINCMISVQTWKHVWHRTACEFVM